MIYWHHCRSQWISIAYQKNVVLGFFSHELIYVFKYVVLTYLYFIILITFTIGKIITFLFWPRINFELPMSRIFHHWIFIFNIFQSDKGRNILESIFMLVSSPWKWTKRLSANLAIWILPPFSRLYRHYIIFQSLVFKKLALG